MKEISPKVFVIAIINIIAVLVTSIILAIIGVAVGVSLGVIFNQPSNTPSAIDNPIFVPVTLQPEFTIAISSLLPSGEAFSNGFMNLRCSLPNNVRVQNNVMVYLDGVGAFSAKQFPTSFQIPTKGLADGAHIVSMTATSTDNISGSGMIQVLVQDPRLELLFIDYPLEIYPGLEVNISVEVAGSPAYFLANYTAIFGQSTIVKSTTREGNTLAGTQLIPLGLVAKEDFYEIPVQVFSTTQQCLTIPGVRVFFQSAQTNPFTIEGGIIDRRTFPQSPPTNMNLNVTLPPDFHVSLTTDQTVKIPLELDGYSNATAVLVGFEGFGQHFSIPLSSIQNSNSRRSVQYYKTSIQNSNSRRSVQYYKTSIQNSNSRRSVQYYRNYTDEEFAQLGGILKYILMKCPKCKYHGSTRVDMDIRPSDYSGALGPISTARLTLASSRLGTLHARLSWDLDVDLDLHVVDPNNEEIYHGHKRSTGQVGLMDIDSICGDNGNIENVFYEQAIPGRYIIRVDFFNNCGINSAISFDLVFEGCNNMKRTVSGTINPNEEDSGALGSGREVLNLVVDCPRFLARGTVSYMGPVSAFSPLGSTVRVVDSRGTVLGRSSVKRNPNNDRSGEFSVLYNVTNGGEPVYLEFLSINDNLDVTDHAGNTHVYRSSSSIIPESEPTATRDIVIRERDGSGAFHIMATMSRMIPLYHAYGGSESDKPLKADWELGKFAKGASVPVSYFSDRTGIISICGNAMDPDEFDESVLLHEFGHLILNRTGAVITGGYLHSSRFQIPPNFAFSEGYSTYLGQKVLEDPIYRDGSVNYDLSDVVSSGRPIGTSLPNDNSGGDISEAVVAGAAYFLDFNYGLGPSMQSSLTDHTKLLDPLNYNRLGDTSAVDFSDLVSLVVCPLPAKERVASYLFLANKYSLPWIKEKKFCL